MIQETILSTLQFILIFGLSSIIYNLSKSFNIKVTWYNLPTILFTFMLLVLSGILCVFKLKIYLMVGIFFGACILILSSIKLESLPEVPLKDKITGFLITMLAWPETMTLLIFYILNMKELDV